MDEPTTLSASAQNPTSKLGVVRQAVWAVLPAWVVARLLVAVAFVVSHLLIGTARPNNPRAAQGLAQGLLGWDAGWYEAIAAHGYRWAGEPSLRFFPAFPLAGRYLSWLLDVGAGTALILLANLCALGAMAVLWILVRTDLRDPGLARPSVWLLALCPSAYTLVMGYADASFLLASLVAFLAIRTNRWWWAAAAGLAVGAMRPVGVLLILPIAVEAWERRRPDRSARSPKMAALAAVLAPAIGAGLYLAWVGHVFADPWLPYHLQMQAGHSGSISAPLTSMFHVVVSSFQGHHLGSALHLPWVVLSLALVVVAFRRLPLSYGIYAAATLCVLLATSNLDSFERYAMDAFPLVIAAGTLTTRKNIERTIFVIAGLVMIGYTVLASWRMVVP